MSIERNPDVQDRQHTTRRSECESEEVWLVMLSSISYQRGGDKMFLKFKSSLRMQHLSDIWFFPNTNGCMECCCSILIHAIPMNQETPGI